jgi:hypothetical protein
MVNNTNGGILNLVVRFKLMWKQSTLSQKGVRFKVMWCNTKTKSPLTPLFQRGTNTALYPNRLAVLILPFEKGG